MTEPSLLIGNRSNWTVRTERLGDQVYQGIIEHIVSSNMDEGTKLLTEEEYCAMFGVSRPVVREALSRLKSDGVVTSRRGSGSYLQRRPDSELISFAPSANIAELVRCFEFRVGLECEAVALAAKRHSAQDLQQITHWFQELEGTLQSRSLGKEADYHFHLSIVSAARNGFFISAFEALKPQIEYGIRLNRSLSLHQSLERMTLVQHEHLGILDALKARDVDAVRAAMRVHLIGARARFLGDKSWRAADED